MRAESIVEAEYTDVSETKVNLVVSAVMPHDIKNIWDKVNTMIYRACKRSGGRHDTHTVYSDLINNHQHLWLAINTVNDTVMACATSQFIMYPTGLKMLDIVMLGGSHKENWLKDGWQVLENWAKDNDCSGIQCVGRRGLAYLTTKQDNSWKEQAVMFEKKFKEDM
tara:strand:+ start:2411 stop:2908 length:498 start_codon:yes stop_codon:yes gene_type:complete